MPSNDYEILTVNDKVAAQAFPEVFIKDIERSSTSEYFVTVDTEFIRENQPKPLLCLIQIATVQHVFIIDPLAENIDLVALLRPILANPELPKVFHSASQDVEVLNTFGIGSIRNIYDTQLHEMLLSSQERTSYQNLVQKYVGKRLNKTCVISDWKRRPLSKKQLRYSVGDVTFLRDIYKAQRSRLEQAGRLHWLKDEMSKIEEESQASLLSSATNILKNDDPAAIKEQLSVWIEERSKEKNIDSKDIMGRQSIEKICRKGRAYVNKLLKYRGLKNKNFRDFLLFAKDIVPQTSEKDRHIDHPSRLKLDALRLILEMSSKASSVAQSLIATTKDLENLIEFFAENAVNTTGTPSSALKCLTGWRYEIFGCYVEGFLRKTLSIAIIEGGKIGFKTES